MKNFHALREELELHEDAQLMKYHKTMAAKHAAARDYHHAHSDHDDVNVANHHDEAGHGHHSAAEDHEHAAAMLKKHGKDHQKYKSAAETAKSMSGSTKADYGTGPGRNG